MTQSVTTACSRIHKGGASCLSILLGSYEEAYGCDGQAMHVLDVSACPRQRHVCLDPAALADRVSVVKSGGL